MEFLINDVFDKILTKHLFLHNRKLLLGLFTVIFDERQLLELGLISQNSLKFRDVIGLVHNINFCSYIWSRNNDAADLP